MKSNLLSKTTWTGIVSAILSAFAALALLDAEQAVSLSCALGDLFGPFDCGDPVIREIVSEKVSSVLMLIVAFNNFVLVPIFRSVARVQTKPLPLVGKLIEGDEIRPLRGPVHRLRD